MARRIRIKTVEDNKVHFDFGKNDYTLCGLDTVGDSSLQIEVPIETKAKVNCEACLAIVKFCKAIKPDEY